MKMIAYAKLFVLDIFGLKRGEEDTAHHFMGSSSGSGRRVEYVQIVGTVVKVKEKAKHDVVGVDDGTVRW
jgi:hypothetical protein